MGWYHYQCAEEDQDVNTPVACPDGTCPRPPDEGSSVSTAEETTTTTTTTELPEASKPSLAETKDPEELYYASTPIYHLCQKKLWEKAVEDEQPYFPPTFWPDGRFTRFSCDITTLAQTANHYYQQIAGDWLCLEVSPVTLRSMGVPIATHRAPESTANDPVECLKVYSGIPTVFPNVVREIYLMQRDQNGKFYGMKPDSSIPKCVTRNQVNERNTTKSLEVKKVQANEQELKKLSAKQEEKQQTKSQESKTKELKTRFWQRGTKT